MSTRLGRALRGMAVFCLWIVLAWPALAQLRSEGAIPDGRGGVIALTTGAHHTCGLRENGTAMCWGDNWYGETKPLPGTFIELSAGFGHTCGLRGDGSVACWGAGYTPLPEQPEPPMPPPSPIPAGRFTTISTAISTTCGLRARSVPWEYPGGNVVCWSASGWQHLSAPPQGDFVALSVGYDFACALRANGKPVCWGYISPEQVPAEDTFIAVSTGARHACGLHADGSVRCWGDNWAGQATPPAELFTTINAGAANTCGLRLDGTVLCWGESGAGQSAPPSDSFTTLATGENFACGLRSDGHVACWGAANWNFQPEPPSPSMPLPPLSPLETVFGMGQLAAGDWHDCQINAQGELTCWGDFSPEPETGTRFSAVSSGWDATCARDEHGQLRCYGPNDMVRIGLPFEPLRQFDLGYEHGCGVAALDGSPKCWGREIDGKTLPPSEPPGQLFRNTSAGLMHSCGVIADGTGQCWGYNGDGQTNIPSLPPERGYLHVDAGERHSCGLDGMLNILCWGMSPQPYEGGYYDPSNPPEFPSFRALSVGGYHSCAIRTDGRLLCWGANWSGQLQAPEGTFVAVSAGHSHSCAIRTDGSRVCWGEPWLSPRLVLEPERIPELRPGEWLEVPFRLRSESSYQVREPRYAIVAGTLPMGFWLDPMGLRGSSNEPGRYPFTVEGRDRNGFAVRRDLVLVIDSTPPVIEPQVTGTLGDNGWYVSPVSLTWSFTDPESEVVDHYGCEPVTIAYETPGDQFFCAAGSAGGLAHQEVLIRVDLVAPSKPHVDATIDGAQASFYFISQDAMGPIASYECSLDGADFSVCPMQLQVAAGQHKLQVFAVDQAGHHSDIAEYLWTVDPTAPVITASVTGTKVFQDWYRSDVRIEWSVSDPETGVTSMTGCEVATLTTDSPQATFTCTATNGVGVSASETVSVKRDATDPVIDLQAKPAAVTGSRDAHFRFAVTDNLSGYWSGSAYCILDHGQGERCGSGAFDALALGHGEHTLEIWAWDVAGNPTAHNYHWSIDTTAPTVDPVVTPSKAPTGWYLRPVTIDFYIGEPDSPITQMTGCGRVELLNDSPGASFTCTVGSAGGTTVKTVAVKLDSTRPDTTITVAPGEPSNPHQTQFEFTGSDATSGVASLWCNLDGEGFRVCASPYTVNVAGGTHTMQVMAQDAAGWQDATPATHTWSVDGTAPVISPTITGTHNDLLWYTSDVHLEWSVSDPDSPVGAKTGCDPADVTTDTTHVGFYCNANSYGGTGYGTANIRRDTVPPQTTFTATPSSTTTSRTAQFAFSGEDLTSGVRYLECSLDGAVFLQCGSPTSYTVSPGSHTLRVRARDFADHVDPTPAEYTWVVDDTPPTIQPVVSGTLGNNGWYVGDVQVNWSVSDTQSPVNTSGCATASATADTTGTSFTCTATSTGGSTSRTVTIKRDTAAPTIVAQATTSPNAAGWYNHAVDVTFSCNDATSGVATCQTSQTLAAEGTSSTSASTVSDAAGNTATSNVVTVKIDRTAPTLAPAVTPGTLLLNAINNAKANGGDALSGWASEQCAPLATDSVGNKTVTCTVTDRAGNSASGSASYRVVYGFNGFTSPVQNPSVLNVFRAGRSVQLRWRVIDAQGAPVSSLGTASVGAIAISCPTATENRISVYGGSNSQLQNLGNGYYQLDWAAAGSLRGYCRRLELNLGDGEVHPALFKFN